MAEKDTGAIITKKKVKISETLPLIVLRDVVVFPHAIFSLIIKRKKSLQAVDAAIKVNRIAMVIAQRDKNIVEPKGKDLFSIGTVVKFREIIKMPDGGIKVLVEGIVKAKIKETLQETPFVKVKIQPIVEKKIEQTRKADVLMQSVLNLFRESVSLGAVVPLDVLLAVVNSNNPQALVDLIVINLDLKIEDKQRILEAEDIENRLDRLARALSNYMGILKMAKKLQSETGKELDKMQREVYLREQLKAIEKELGEEEGKSELGDLKDKIEKAGMPKETKEKALKELKRLQRMPSFSPEVSYVRTYLDWLVNLPWDKKSEQKIDTKEAKKILDEDHFGLDKAKERIIEYLAVQKLVGKIRGPILCFAGPPGTGKTSIGKSIARALGRKFIRMSLGGIRDEAEIRGHRRTYVGALPGRIIQGISDAGARNPVFMLDEIDKVGADFRGDPSSALLEALDPEQNYSFSDHYLEVPFDLSDVMFITTANILDTIPPALRDRMEVIGFPGYIQEEKFNIAKKYLLPKQIKDNGLKNLDITENALKDIIEKYTREAGVRNLEREIATVCRKTARDVAEGKKVKKVDDKNLPEFLGPTKFAPTLVEKSNAIGIVAGLAWTQVGGEILLIEATKMSGKENLILTGHMGKVMKESAMAALSFAKSKAKDLGIKEDAFKDQDVHIHVPAGAIPKDGPSAGVAMTLALISLFSGRTVDRKVAMTGEITLRGRALEIGGVKEKVLAAYRGGIRKIILPKENEKALEEIPETVKKALEFYFVENMEEVVDIALIK